AASPVSEAVPTSAVPYKDHLLVTLFGGFPFTVGASRIVEVDPVTGAVTPFLNGLTSVIDVAPAGNGTVYVLEFTTNLLANAPGKLLAVGNGTVQEALPVLITPTSMALD